MRRYIDLEETILETGSKKGTCGKEYRVRQENLMVFKLILL
jgi:hypothetical protein